MATSQSYEFKEGTTGASQDWPSGVSWRGASIDLTQFYLTILDAIDRRPPQGSKFSRYGFSSILHRWSNPQDPGRSVSDLMVLVNGTFWDLSKSNGNFGDLIGHSLDPIGRSLGLIQELIGADLGEQGPDLACRWYVGTLRGAHGRVEMVRGRGRRIRACSQLQPLPFDRWEMLLGGGVLLHDPTCFPDPNPPGDKGFDAVALPPPEYKRRFNEWNPGWWKAQSGAILERQKPFPQPGDSPTLEENPLSAALKRARWAIAALGSNRALIVSVGEGLNPTSGMPIDAFARFVVRTFNPTWAVMFDGSKPHAFAACPEADAALGQPAVQKARCMAPNDGGDPLSLVAAFRRIGANVTKIISNQQDFPVARSATDLSVPTTVDAPAPRPPPDTPSVTVEIELRRLSLRDVQFAVLSDGVGQTISSWGPGVIRFGPTGTFHALAEWRPRADPARPEHLRLQVSEQTSAGTLMVLASHQVVVHWRRTHGRLKVQVFGNMTRFPLDGIRIDARAQAAGSQTTASTSLGGLASLIMALGPASLEFSDPEGRVEPESIVRTISADQGSAPFGVALVELVWQVSFRVIDAVTKRPLATAEAKVRLQGGPLWSSADSTGTIRLGLPYADLQIEVTEPTGRYLPSRLPATKGKEPRYLGDVELPPVDEPGPSRIQGTVRERPKPGATPRPWSGRLLVSKRDRPVFSGDTLQGGSFDIHLPETSGLHQIDFLVPGGGGSWWSAQSFDAPRDKTTRVDFVIDRNDPE